MNQPSPRPRRAYQAARRGSFYDGIVFHRVIEGFMAQTGCPKGTGTGDRISRLKAEFNAEPHVRHGVDGPRAEPEFGQFAVLHLLRRRQFSRQAIHRLGKVVSGMEMSTRSSAANRCAIPTRS